MGVADPWIIAIGASAGGIDPICQLVAALPAKVPAIIIVALHRRAGRASYLEQILRRHVRLPVVVPGDGEQLRAGMCYVSSASSPLTIGPDHAAQLRPEPARDYQTIDALFVSLARHGAPRIVGVVLSGLLSDGALGLASIKAAGGVALVQSPSQAAYKDMPQNAIEAGPVDCIGDIDTLAAQICRIVNELN
jgi:two-component system chemotaxis response regulator CheB